jgi:DNA-binding NtrC family response regulator
MTSTLDYKAYPVLFVDDEQPLIETLRLNYERDFTFLAASGGRQALDIVAGEPVAVLVTDQRMPEMSGLEVIQRALALKPELIPIILTGYTDIETLVGAINLGRIHRYIPKPFDSRELRSALESAIETFHLTRENVRLAEDNERLIRELATANERLAVENGYSQARRRPEWLRRAPRPEPGHAARDRSRAGCSTSTTVLIDGASRTGKELMARAIHHEGARRDELFVPRTAGP